jgi:hypothetical protein
MKKPPKEITICHLEVVVMPNGEIICGGKSLGWMSSFGKYLTMRDQCRKRETDDDDILATKMTRRK